MGAGDENDEPRERTAPGDRTAVHGHAGTERPPAAQNRRGSGLHAYLRLGGRAVLRRQWPPEHRSGGLVQAGTDSASVRDQIAAADDAGRGSERGLPVVSRVHDVAAAAAFCDDQLCVPASIHGGSDRGSVPLGAGRSGTSWLSVAGSSVCGRDPHQGERESEEACEEVDPKGSETLPGAADAGSRCGSRCSWEKAAEEG